MSKYDANGNPIWNLNFDTSKDDDALTVSADGLGNVYVAGIAFERNVSPSQFATEYAGDHFTVKLTASGSSLSGLAGDANNDGIVDINDFNLVQNMFGHEILVPGFNGDANGDGVVDVGDYNAVANNYGQHAIALTLATAVPEPTSLGLLVCGGLLALAYRWRRQA